MSDGARLADALAIRLRVFVLEQNVPFDEEVDIYDARPGTVHALAYARDVDADAEPRPLGTGRLYAHEDGSARIGRMAVERSARGTGVGAAILTALLEEARVRGFTRATLFAQVAAVGFYARAGFERRGEIFLDGGIDHVLMECSLAHGNFPGNLPGT
jgi:predicted GNAT family N-acyltransferase